ncbi:hypothetical protein XNC1_3204 [Xenorhabdus nematophila ATCC 19061]|uniref:Uncharacterized protein n=1 Tax=Xenorhabdus nematophila (strain ATCC 19061 / DSM 3370 / CCUG 14189 / LMG 1036 / NCIMB 9965 / AN6) TaxID=406817 RepID=D3VLD0_XENNA|nr:hypothetical protein XNC1_3204 [Xenorhabdus nematophila ATCC 19061]
MVEHLPYKEGVISSNLVSPTISLVVISNVSYERSDKKIL